MEFLLTLNKKTMKTTTLLLLLFSIVSTAQIKFIDKEYFTTSIGIDPNATRKDGLNMIAEIELVSYWKYVKLNTQIQPSLQGGYIDLVGGFGMNLTSGKFDQWRAYAGGRLGFINRAKYVYPLAGAEIGIDYNIEKLFIGIRATGDYRSDFIFTDGTPSMRYSGYVRIGTQF